LDSNRIYIEGKPLENWLNAETGKSQCCDACGDNECRTLIYEGTAYEDVPAGLIVLGIVRAVKAIFQVELSQYADQKTLFSHKTDNGKTLS